MLRDMLVQPRRDIAPKVHRASDKRIIPGNSDSLAFHPANQKMPAYLSRHLASLISLISCVTFASSHAYRLFRRLITFAARTSTCAVARLLRRICLRARLLSGFTLGNDVGQRFCLSRRDKQFLELA